MAQELTYQSKYTGAEIDARLEAVEKAVMTIEQTLSDSQKAQARENIDVVGGGEVADLIKFMRTEKMRREYFTITAGEDGADIVFYCSEEAGTTKTVSVSTDGGQTWTQKESSYAGTLLASLSAGQKMLVKGTNDAIGYFSDEEGEYIGNYFFSEDTFFVSGNIMSLLYGDSFSEKFHLSQDNEGTFAYLFSDYYEERTGNGVDINPAAPLVLPATTLAGSCYSSMFRGCTGLTSAPLVLPATTLADNCYGYMFRDCTGLTSAPELPATTLAGNCYNSMFEGCTGLTSAPELPATTLADNCYGYMFRGCTGLTSAPELPATTLADSCYGYMFRGCTGLNYVKCLATNISASNSHNNWLSDVAASGTFVKGAGMTDWPTGADGIPSGWTVEDAA